MVSLDYDFDQKARPMNRPPLKIPCENPNWLKQLFKPGIWLADENHLRKLFELYMLWLIEAEWRIYASVN